MRSLSLLQQIFLTQESNRGLLHCKRILYQLSYQGSPRRAKVKGKVASDSLQPHSLSMEFSRPEYWSGQPFPSPGDLANPGIESRSPAVEADSLPAEPQGKPRNTGGGSLSLLQRVFPTEESNQGLLHCKRILYQLSYQGSLPLNLSIVYFFLLNLVHLYMLFPLKE